MNIKVEKRDSQTLTERQTNINYDCLMRSVAIAGGGIQLY